MKPQLLNQSTSFNSNALCLLGYCFKDMSHNNDAKSRKNYEHTTVSTDGDITSSLSVIICCVRRTDKVVIECS